MNSNVIALWQPVGYSTHIIAKKVAQKLGVLTSHTGTLDPIAEGVIIILLGDYRNQKYELAKWEKGYQFEIVFGIRTDSFDGLGIADICEKTNKFTQEKIISVLNEFKGEYTQEVPPYSAIKVKGKPMHWYARNSLLHKIELPKRSGQIYEIKLLETRQLPLKGISRTVINKINKVSGNLRQQEIIKNWNFLSQENTNSFFSIKIYVKTSKGLYIRRLAADIAKELGTWGFVLNLTRISNGIYTINNSQSLEKFFGKDYEQKYNFKSKT